jgi:hypothetical protein
MEIAERALGLILFIAFMGFLVWAVIEGSKKENKPEDDN